MTSESFKALRQSVASELTGVGGLNGYARLPGNINLPAAVVMPSPGIFYSFDTTMSRGTDDVKLTVLLLVATALNETAQDQLDEFLPGGAYNLKPLLENNLNLQVEYVTVDAIQNYTLHNVAGAQYFGCEALLTVGVEPVS